MVTGIVAVASVLPIVIAILWHVRAVCLQQAPSPAMKNGLGSGALPWLYLLYLCFLAVSLHLDPVMLIYSALLLATAYLDAKFLVISSYLTLATIPFAFVLAYSGRLPLTLVESVVSALLGFSILWITNAFFKYFRKQDGIGSGDFDLLATIGAWTGLSGMLIALYADRKSVV